MIVVNFSTNNFHKAQERLKDSLVGHKSLILRQYPKGSPTHQSSPYEFKIYAIQEAFKKDDIVLWADSSMYLVGDLSRIENIIRTQGYFMEEAGHYVRTWCNDHTRKYFDLQPEESEFKMFSAGLLGINRKDTSAMQWFLKWKAAAKAGCFKGEWSNHRHDMTCGSIIAERMGFKYQRGSTHLAYIGPGYPEPQSDAVFYCQGL
jgi:hypothetical protein